MKHSFLPIGLSLVLCATAGTGCQSPGGSTTTEQRQDVRSMRDQALTDLYAEDPTAQAVVEAAAGYAVFSNLGTKILVVSLGNGYGIAVDNATGRDTFMKMGEAGAGLGMGVKKFRAVFVFKRQESFDDFLNSGWDFGGDADAAAKHGDSGGAKAGQASFDSDISIYQLTDTGLALSATLGGTKYWKDDELN